MPSRIENESEHRRGLVLGLTLAEALILLLFLILLALGARLVKVERALTDINPLVEELRKHEALATIDARTLVLELAKLKDFEKKVREQDKLLSDLRDENARLGRELKDRTNKLSVLEKAVAAASVIDPNDPPALLKFAPDAFEVVSLKIDRTRWSHVSELVTKWIKTEAAMNEAERERFRQSLYKFLETSEGSTPPHSWPPIIRLSDADDYFFVVGSAELTPDFSRRLQTEVIPRLLDIARAHQVDVIEVVGHTDDQPNKNRTSNLDTELFAVLRREKDVRALIFSDNAGLGLARAVAVVDILKRDSRLADFRILPLSGAQLIQTDENLTSGNLTGNVRERRRIEIRLRKRT